MSDKTKPGLPLHVKKFEDAARDAIESGTSRLSNEVKRKEWQATEEARLAAARNPRQNSK